MGAQRACNTDADAGSKGFSNVCGGVIIQTDNLRTYIIEGWLSEKHSTCCGAGPAPSTSGWRDWEAYLALGASSSGLDPKSGCLWSGGLEPCNHTCRMPVLSGTCDTRSAPSATVPGTPRADRKEDSYGDIWREAKGFRSPKPETPRLFFRWEITTPSLPKTRSEKGPWQTNVTNAPETAASESPCGRRTRKH